MPAIPSVTTCQWPLRSSESQNTHLSDAWHAEEAPDDGQLAQEREHDREEVAVQSSTACCQLMWQVSDPGIATRT